jgi:very-short-patch-repair endonuclease
MASDTPDGEDIAVEKNKELTKKAQSLRKSQTKEESLLWYQFLCRYPIRFRRQYVIGNYIVDFYCHKAKLVVELDGSQHYSPDEIEYDRVRTRWLEMMGLRVIRFTNLEVMRQFRSVCEAIDMTVKQILGTEELG